MKANIVSVLLVVHLYLCIAGCSEHAVPIVGGTAGVLTSDGKPMSQMELTFYSDSPFSGEPLAYAPVQTGGGFELVNASRTAATELAPGRYRITLESLGAELEIPKQYSDPLETTLRVEHVPPEPVAIEIPGLSTGM